MAEARRSPRWQCVDCGRIFRGSQIDPQTRNVDDVADVFSKGRNRGENICPSCGGDLQLISA